jgi:hypothetical protein
MYQFHKNAFGGEPVIVIRLSDNAFIPLNAPDNTDHQEYLRWLEAGNTPEPAEENQ